MPFFGLLTVCGGIVLGVAAIVLGFIGRGRVKRGEATNGGVAMAGIVLGFLGVVVSIVAIALAIWSFDVFGGGDLVDCLQRAGNDPAAQQQCEEDFTSNVEDQFSVTLTPTP
jgi:heme/copper-type cytochrome/quinol oxidase subunit 2